MLTGPRTPVERRPTARWSPLMSVSEPIDENPEPPIASVTVVPAALAMAVLAVAAGGFAPAWQALAAVVVVGVAKDVVEVSNHSR